MVGKDAISVESSRAALFELLGAESCLGRLAFHSSSTPSSSYTPSRTSRTFSSRIGERVVSKNPQSTRVRVYAIARDTVFQGRKTRARGTHSRPGRSDIQGREMDPFKITIRSAAVVAPLLGRLPSTDHRGCACTWKCHLSRRGWIAESSSFDKLP